MSRDRSSSGAPLQVPRLSYDFEGIALRFAWFPGLTLPARECEALSELVVERNEASPNPFRYGFFALSPAHRLAFMTRSIWCAMYRGDRLCGFAYNYDVGPHEGKRVIHLGLVKFHDRVGREALKAVYNGFALGNLVNFGPHYGSNITHVPLIIDLACHYIRDVYPHPSAQDPQLRRRYGPILDLLVERYAQPVLGYAPAAIDRHGFRVPNALDMHASGFESAWDDLPKSDETICNLFARDWLTVQRGADGRDHVKDDLIQIGVVDFTVLGAPRNLDVYHRMRPLADCPGLVAAA